MATQRDKKVAARKARITLKAEDEVENGLEAHLGSEDEVENDWEDDVEDGEGDVEDGEEEKENQEPPRKKRGKQPATREIIDARIKRWNKRLGAPSAESGDLFMKLAPELRNVVYSIVLDESPKHSDIHGQPVPIRIGRTHKRKAWREPGILRASKEIRTEATAVYYGNNKFCASVHLSDVTNLTAWLESVIKLCGEEQHFSFNIKMIPGPTGVWGYLHRMLPLVRLIHRTGFMGLWAPENGHVQGAMSLAIDLATKGVEKAWTEAEMTREFKDWLKILMWGVKPQHKRRQSRNERSE